MGRFDVVDVEVGMSGWFHSVVAYNVDPSLRCKWILDDAIGVNSSIREQGGFRIIEDSQCGRSPRMLRCKMRAAMLELRIRASSSHVA